MLSVWERVRDYCGSLLSQRPEAGRSAESSRLCPDLQRRREPRAAKGETCEFSMTHALSADDVRYEEGAGMTVNLSPSGMQLLLGVAPRSGQLLEVHVGDRLQRSVALMEVRWTKPVREDAQGQLHLVGCRLTFGPTSYWAL